MIHALRAFGGCPRCPRRRRLVRPRPDGAPVPGALGLEAAAPAFFDAFARLAPKPVALPPPPASARIVTMAGLPAPLRAINRRPSLAEQPFAIFSFGDNLKRPVGTGLLVTGGIKKWRPQKLM